MKNFSSLDHDEILEILGGVYIYSDSSGML